MQKSMVLNSEHYLWGEGCEGWHFLKREDISIIKEKMPPHTSEQAHFHNKSRQFFYILSGIATFKINDQIIQVNSGEGIEIEPGEQHQIRNKGSEALEFILFSSPTTRGDRVNV